MGADISRVRFDARNDYNGVVIQQGRVRLDADDNELTAITDRRLRAQTADLGSYGLADTGVAVIPRTTPDAFKLTLTAGALTIGRGRIYVDGILAENHGTGAVYDPLLAELTGDTDTAYTAQPYLPNPPALPKKGTHLIYLDVWERELTPDQRPDLVEPALGVDTTARTQVVWQVLAFAPDTPGIDCSTPSSSITGWPDLIAPPTARLTVGTEAVPAADDPCSLPPAGGYRGLENQTYRVQIHKPGAAGTATFTWSRDNGSVAIAVTEVVSATQLRLASLGKDADFLGVKTGDWVEIIDDAHELSGSPGELRHVTVHPEDQSVSFDSPPPGTSGGTGPLPAGWPTTTTDAVAGHLRVRRWDGTDGETTIGAVPIGLEHGITVALTAGADGFKTGQYWTFAARTATADVEPLTSAPALGPKHHYARLGVIDFTGQTVVSAQCPPLWPPDSAPGCDTVTVCPDEHKAGHMTIQQAINTVISKGGGSVCLCAGTFTLDEPLMILKGNGVWLRGQGAATIVQSHADVIDVQGSRAISITDMRLVSDNTTTTPTGAAAMATAVVRLQHNRDVSLERLGMATSGTLAISDAYGTAPPAGSAGVALQGSAISTRIRDCEVSADVCVTSIGGKGVNLHTLEITGSTLSSSTAGVHLEGATLSGLVRVGDNVVVGGDIGLNLISNAQDADVIVHDNDVSEATTGIAVADNGYTIVRNTVSAPAQAVILDAAPVADQAPQSIGVKARLLSRARTQTTATYTGSETLATEKLPAKENLAANATLTASASDTTEIAAGIVARTNLGASGLATRITGNTVTGFPVGILADTTAPVVVIDDNQVTGSDLAGIAAVGSAFSTSGGIDLTSLVTACRIQDNVVSQIGLNQSDTALANACAGIYAIGFQNADVTSNLVTTIGSPQQMKSATGLLVMAADSALVAGNTFRDVGASPKETDSADILIVGVNSLTVVNNICSRAGQYLGANTIGLHIFDGGSAVQHKMESFHANLSSQPVGDYTYTGGTTDVAVSRTGKVTGNSLLGGPTVPAMSAQIQGIILVADNHFARAAEGSGSCAKISANALTFSGNHAAGRDYSAQLTCAEKDKYTILGNLTEGQIEINGGLLAGAWAPLNISGVF